MQNKLTFDFNNLTSAMLGEKGIRPEQMSTLCHKANKALCDVQANRGKGMQGWMNLPFVQQFQIDEILHKAKEVREKCEYFVVLGIGGSALGPMAVFNALCHLRHNELSKGKRSAPKFYVEDNIDPDRMKALFDVIDVKKTVFNVITKSGATSETMAQLLIVIDLIKKEVGENFKDHIVATTDRHKGNLIEIAKQHDLTTFFIEENIGGRFSIFSPVGLFPSAVLGLDIKAILDGAAHMDEICKQPLEKNPALMLAMFMYRSMQEGKNISVLMPYSDRLKLVADWYCQLYGESLGKKFDRQGGTVHCGQTPVKAVGATDQHSQLQLYAEGPYDKVVGFVEVQNFDNTVDIPVSVDGLPSGVAFLGGKTLGKLISSELHATQFALTKAGRQNYLISLSQVNEHTVGQLLYFFMMQTAFMGELLDIDAYNQPGVEEGKNATYALLGKAGFEQKAEELKSMPAKDLKLIF